MCFVLFEYSLLNILLSFIRGSQKGPLFLPVFCSNLKVGQAVADSCSLILPIASVFWGRPRFLCRPLATLSSAWRYGCQIFATCHTLRRFDTSQGYFLIRINSSIGLWSVNSHSLFECRRKLNDVVDRDETSEKFTLTWRRRLLMKHSDFIIIHLLKLQNLFSIK